jgi:hypothetical protein
VLLGISALTRARIGCHDETVLPQLTNHPPSRVVVEALIEDKKLEGQIPNGRLLRRVAFCRVVILENDDLVLWHSESLLPVWIRVEVQGEADAAEEQGAQAVGAAVVAAVVAAEGVLGSLGTLGVVADSGQDEAVVLEERIAA